MGSSLTEEQKHQKTKTANYAILAFSILIIFGAYITTQSALRTATPFYAVSTGSMAPTINVGDVVVVQGVGSRTVNFLFFQYPISGINPRDLKVGDVIVFEREGAPPIIHRIISIMENNRTLYFMTKGDATQPDRLPVHQNAVIGKEVAIIPFIGYLSQPVGLLALFALVVAVYVASTMLKKRKSRTVGDAGPAAAAPPSSGLFSRRRLILNTA